MRQDTSSSNTQLHQCTIERVYPSGLVDARSDREKFFEQVNTLFFAAEGNYTVGSRCLVVSDGSQHLVVAQLRDPTLDDSGFVTTKEINNDLSDLTNSRALVASDSFGLQAKIVASPGGGVIIDSGDNAMSHYDSGNNKIMNISDRYELLAMPCSVEMDHDGVVASTRYKWRTLSDALSWDRDLGRDRDDALDLGGIVTADIGPAPEVVDVSYKTQDQVLANIQIGIDGNIVISGVKGFSEININAEGVQLNTEGGQITVDQVGGIKIGTDAVDLLDLVDQTLTELMLTTKVATSIGLQPLISPGLPVIRTALNSIKG